MKHSGITEMAMSVTVHRISISHRIRRENWLIIVFVEPDWENKKKKKKKKKMKKKKKKMKKKKK